MDRLYWLNGFPDDVASEVEDTFFAPVDTNASIVMRKMNDGASTFTPAERIAWTQFLVSLVFRHPENLEATRERLSKTAREPTRAQERRYQRLRGPGDPKTMKEALRLDFERDPEYVHRQAVQLIADLTGSENIEQNIFRMHWGSLKLPLGTRALMTSDRPLHWFGGLADSGCHILMPLGPKRVFWAVNSIGMANLIMHQRPERVVEFVNEHTVRRARKFVYAMGDDQLDYVQRYMGTGQELSVADLIAQLPTVSLRRRRKAVFNPAWLRPKP